MTGNIDGNGAEPRRSSQQKVSTVSLGMPPCGELLVSQVSLPMTVVDSVFVFFCIMLG
jgi:hypothetical protein